MSNIMAMKTYCIGYKMAGLVVMLLYIWLSWASIVICLHSLHFFHAKMDPNMIVMAVKVLNNVDLMQNI